MKKHTITLSDTSHPFTSVSEETDRTLTREEFAAIRTFQSEWGYTGNDAFGDDLVDMLANTHTPIVTLISHFMNKWDLSDEIRTDVQNLFILRESVTRTFTQNEDDLADAIEKGHEMGIPPHLRESDKWVSSWHNDPKHNEETHTRTIPVSLTEYNKAGNFGNSPTMSQLIADRGKSVSRIFLGEMGTSFVVYYVTEMPENYNEMQYNTLGKAYLRNADDTSLYYRATLHFTREAATDQIDTYRQLLTETSTDWRVYEYELDKM